LQDASRYLFLPLHQPDGNRPSKKKKSLREEKGLPMVGKKRAGAVEMETPVQVFLAVGTFSFFKRKTFFSQAGC